MKLSQILRTVFIAAVLLLNAGCGPVNEAGILRVGFDIDDTVLLSRDIFVNLPADKRSPIDFAWVNLQDRQMSKLITPTAELIHFFNAHGHQVFFITARPGDNGDTLAAFLTEQLGFPVIKNANLFFEPKQTLGDQRYTTKHRRMKKLDLDLYYGDSDTDIIAALKAGVHPVRVVRHQSSIDQYGKNFFGDTTDGTTIAAPFSDLDKQLFYRASVGVFGESIYPIIWPGPTDETE